MLNLVMMRFGSWGEIVEFEKAYPSFVCELEGFEGMSCC